MKSSIFLELQLLFSGGMGYAEMAIYPPKSRFPMEKHGFLYDVISTAARRHLDGNDNSAPVEDLDNKNPPLVALGNRHHEPESEP